MKQSCAQHMAIDGEAEVVNSSVSIPVVSRDIFSIEEGEAVCELGSEWGLCERNRDGERQRCFYEAIRPCPVLSSRPVSPPWTQRELALVQLLPVSLVEPALEERVELVARHVDGSIGPTLEGAKDAVSTWAHASHEDVLPSLLLHQS